jgi:hypothetical protein
MKTSLREPLFLILSTSTFFLSVSWADAPKISTQTNHQVEALSKDKIQRSSANCVKLAREKFRTQEEKTQRHEFIKNCRVKFTKRAKN